MKQTITNQEGLLMSLTKILYELKELFYKSTLEVAIKHSKRVAKLLLYYSKRIKYLLEISNDDLPNTLSQCFKLIGWFVSSSEFRKFGHIFPFYSYITKIFNHLTGRFDKIDKGQCHQSILERMGKNQASSFYKSIKKWQILPQEFHFLNSHRLEGFIDSLEQKKIILPNSQCVGCSQVFMRNLTILNNNPVFSSLLGIQTLDSENLQRLLSCIVNKNGGVILIGAKKISNSLRIGEGLHFETYQQISEASKLIRSSILKIKPQCKFLIQEIPVQNSFYQSSDFELQHLGLCFRVLIFPQHNKVSYLEFTSKNKLPYYETYQLDSEENPVLIKSNNQNRTVYTIIHQKYYQRSHQRANSHEGINCFQSAPYNPPILNYDTSHKNMAMSKLQQLVNQNSKEYPDKPKFKYPRVSLLIVNSTKEERQIQKFGQYLAKKKIQFDLKKPFPNSFKCNPGDRLVWTLSHKLTFVNLRNTILKAQDEGQIKPVIKAMPVQTTLQIQEAKFSNYFEKILEKRFQERYPKGYITEEISVKNKKNQQQKIFFLMFPDLEQSLYAFMIMQELNLKPFFTKNGQIYQKK